MKPEILFVTILSIILVTFSYGFLAGVYEYFPYNELSNIKKIILNEDTDKSIITSTSFEKFDINSIIEIETKEDLNDKKTSLIKYIWKNQMPTKLPTNIEENFIDDNFRDVKNLQQIDKITIEMEHGINSIAYLFIPYESNNKLIIYHQGHGGDFLLGKNTIQFFLKNGYTIAAFSMPLVGMNNQPIVNLEHLGPIKFTGHKQFQLLETDDFSPISYFFTPINYTLNYLDDNYDFTSYYMIGISGGGWTSTIYPAVDTRISKSFAINGSLPLFLRVNPEDVGDYEQFHPDLLKITNYLELYIMSSYGENREFTQIFNKYDPCCFAGLKYEHYEVELQQIINKLGKGNFSVISDDTHNQHVISDFSLELIEKNLKK